MYRLTFELPGDIFITFTRYHSSLYLAQHIIPTVNLFFVNISRAGDFYSEYNNSLHIKYKLILMYLFIIVINIAT